MKFKHALLERNVVLLAIGIVVTIAIGGLVEIVPLHTIKSTIEPVQGVRPYTPLELAGRNIYLREGCYNCHSQMVRPFRDEVERYGHYSLAAESMYDHPFQWGTKRTGPDLARVGGKYSDQWHVDHMRSPRGIVPESVMPGYPFLERTALDYSDIDARMKVLRMTGVPYTEEMIAKARQDLEAQVNPDSKQAKELTDRYAKAAGGRNSVRVAKFDGKPGQPSELDALIAYLQVLGQMVDFATFDASGPNLR